ncbi:hypothetical protein SAMN05421823_11177 [Catalinimonas alkaloidigena]|uniref:Amidohydrolase 3 domain-containing protein n=1 Tax=Catalinimonas alkaloidigena TaxID=1075417 RepID=A0A1G9RBA5_9BACT|nr:amidohydrolase [Catalinimonas alkaloidigena]SDM19685.1 hypothetical protein SAMN05421823_11177 [Catalinimonas alkaloidigena]
MSLVTRLFLLSSLPVVLFACSSARETQPAPAELVLRDAAIYTVDSARSWAEAIAVDQGRIVYVGTNEGVNAWTGPQTEVHSLQGRMILPGFHDAHVHPLMGGIELGECDLNGLDTPEAILDSVQAYATAHPALDWIRGGGWDLPIFPQAHPRKEMLDRIVADRPVFLTAADGHSAWVNSLALQRVGITRTTPDPPNGRIERDPRTGEPTGTLREAAVELVANQLPPYTAADYEAGLRRGLALANRLGITSLLEASANQPMLEAYRALDQRGELTARMVVSMKADLAQGEAQLPQLQAWRDTYQGKRLRTSTVKIFADGVIEARTAAMLEPYLDTGDRGALNLAADSLTQFITALDREGFQVHVHAIGDRAIRTALDGFERARNENGVRDSRHHIAHLELIDSADIPRFRTLGVVANFQPLWAFADTYITDLTEPALGPARSRWLYPINSVVATGATTAFGSDWSVSSMNPLDGIQVGVTHLDPDDSTGTPWLPQERVDLPTMLAGYTLQGAYVSFQEQETGSIEVGKAADLVVLDRNLFQIPPHEIHRAKVLMTFLEGALMYQADQP